MQKTKLPADLDGMELVATQNMAMYTAIRALIGADPDKQAVVRIFDQLCGQTFATADYVAKPSKAAAVKAWAEILFAPPVGIEM